MCANPIYQWIVVIVMSTFPSATPHRKGKKNQSYARTHAREWMRDASLVASAAVRGASSAVREKVEGKIGGEDRKMKINETFRCNCRGNKLASVHVQRHANVPVVVGT